MASKSRPLPHGRASAADVRHALHCHEAVLDPDAALTVHDWTQLLGRDDDHAARVLLRAVTVVARHIVSSSSERDEVISRVLLAMLARGRRRSEPAAEVLLTTWIRGFVWRISASDARSRARRTSLLSKPGAARLVSSGSVAAPDGTSPASELHVEIEEAIVTLGEPCRSIARLRLDGATRSDVHRILAARLGIGPDMVRIYWRRTTRRLRAALLSVTPCLDERPLRSPSSSCSPPRDPPAQEPPSKHSEVLKSSRQRRPASPYNPPA